MAEGLPGGMPDIRYYTAAGHIVEPLADRVLPRVALFRERLQQQEKQLDWPEFHWKKGCGELASGHGGYD
jgi:hypothetical protein